MVFGVIDFLQKTNKRIQLSYYETSGKLVFVCFLEEIDDPKKHFENNKPLEWLLYLHYTGGPVQILGSQGIVQLRNPTKGGLVLNT